VLCSSRYGSFLYDGRIEEHFVARGWNLFS